ncbi:MAG: hypothetical protein ABJC19_12220 [Gemmatimonadota bacterium]
MSRSPHPHRTAIAAIPLLGAVLLAGAHARRSPEADFVAIVKAFIALDAPPSWDAIERLPTIRWAALPPTSLQNCLPDGGCFVRQGTATVAGRTLAVVATGARSMVLNLYFRNSGAAFGEAAVVAALKEAALSPALARCPLKPGSGSTNWYRLTGPGYLSVQAATANRPMEGFVVGHGAELPRLQPNQLALYSEQCTAGAARAPVSTSKPHELLAQAVVALLAPAGVAGYDWKALPTLAPDVAWDAAGPKRIDLSFKNDPNPLSLNGTLKLAGRAFSMMASGTATQVKVIYFDEMGLHPRGEHMLGVVYEKGIAVQLARCGPVYTESTNNWYNLTSTRTRPAAILQSIRYDGSQVQDAYVLRLDGTLPAREARDRSPGVAGC